MLLSKLITALVSGAHTHTHTAVGSHLFGGSVPCSWAPCRGIEGEEGAVHSLPHLQFLPDQDSNSQPFDYELISIYH